MATNDEVEKSEIILRVQEVERSNPEYDCKKTKAA
jgi:hypothetical protein